MTLLNMFTAAFTLLGLFFFVAGTLGLLRFPDVFSRLHALTKADNLGLGLIALGLLPQTMSFFDSLQLVITWCLVMISGAVSSFLIANYALVHFAEPVNIATDIGVQAEDSHEREIGNSHEQARGNHHEH